MNNLTMSPWEFQSVKSVYELWTSTAEIPNKLVTIYDGIHQRCDYWYFCSYRVYLFINEITSVMFIRLIST